MKLSTQEADLFFELMWSLQFYVNKKLKLIPQQASPVEYKDIDYKDKSVIRNALYENITLIDDYLKENPQNFSAENLNIIKSWKKFQKGRFIIERFLKRYAVFIHDDVVYGVVALYDELEDVLWGNPMPYLSEAVLLPFKGKIIYDGLLQGSRLYFGGGMKSNFKEIYMTAKQNKRIITSFDEEFEVEEFKKPSKEIIQRAEDIAKEAKKLSSGKDMPAIHSPAFSLAKTGTNFAKLALDDPDDTVALWKALKQIERAVRKAETILYRAES